MSTVQLRDKEFRLQISSERIAEAVKGLAGRINKDLADAEPLFICVLNGAFMFASDLMKELKIDCEISFVKLASYSGTSSTGQVKTLIGLDHQVKDRTVVIVEDIVDMGLTIADLIEQLEAMGPKEIKIATLLFKPDAYTKQIKLDYVGIEVGNEFLVGYGLDYDGLGRNLEHIYILNEE